jgi:hypothetical protein
MTVYDMIEAIEACGVKLGTSFNKKTGKWLIHAAGLSGPQKMQLAANRDEIANLLGVRQLAVARRECAENEPDKDSIDMGRLGKWYARSASMTGDKLRAFMAGWNRAEARAEVV